MSNYRPLLRTVGSRIWQIGNSLSSVGYKLISRYGTEQETNAPKWVSIHGDKTLRVEYDLRMDSVVCDLGGYEGQWASDMFARYRCTVHVFEPVTEFAANIQKRFARNPNIRVYPFGLAGRTAQERIFVNENSTSLYRAAFGNTKTIQLMRAVDFFTQNEIEFVDVMKINIEGAEYELIAHLIESNLVTRIRNIQVQFHDFMPHAQQQMRLLQQQLSATHHLTYNYPFVWENWALNTAHDMKKDL